MAVSGHEGMLPTRIDTHVASIARVYDCFLGGKDNYAVDREVHQRITDIAPEAGPLARDCRRWLVRVIRYLANIVGIDQFLDLGSGLPTAENTHQVAQRMNRDAVVVYVDNDPIVAAHGRALLVENERTHFLVADLRESRDLLWHPAVTRRLDFERPVALLQCCTLHHLEDDDRPREIMAAYIDALPTGSYVALTHFYDPADGSALSALAHEIERRFRTSSMGTSRFRTRQEIESYFDGLELVPASPDSDLPPVGLVRDWWPEGPRQREPHGMENLILCGLARKP
ncbi:SAM-dependent methyltransferase [Saccharopolyspora sp. ASAGF58]|uniref:SAM-dependent methyltransferase n=1 Tax=Saccharopolyspora sp. ASAGF58 TaxID=2719023 RepID=UPI0014401D51|nr:SAM-dependent methyltransferase [Saccharopolyspora sp. ASAGF58]QIZ37926.1 hypothetical protein FDZ84_29375 [Saccharopolyspora sp. ASAGF58]